MRTNLRGQEVSLNGRISSSATFRRISLSTTRPLMPCFRMTFCAIFQGGPRSWVRSFAY